MKKSVLAVLLAFCLVLSLSCCGNSNAYNLVYSDVEKIADGATLSGAQTVVAAENDNLILSVQPDTGEFFLTVKENNYIWYSVPQTLDTDPLSKEGVKNTMRSQLTIECGDMVNHIVSKYNSWTDSVSKSGLTVVHHENKGFTAKYYFPDIMITIPVRYTLSENSLEAEIVVGEILEEGDYKVLSADFLSAFGAGSTEETGYMVVPDGSGAVIEFNNKKLSYNNFSIPVYGSDLSVTDKTISGYSKAYMPVFGINNGENGMLAVITRGEAQATVNAMISGKTSGYNTVNPSFTIRNSKTVSIDRHSGVVENGGNSFIMFDTKPQTLNSVAVKYHPLTGENSNYSGMASRYGKYLEEEKGVQKSEQGKQPLFLDIYGSINAEQKRLFTTVLKPFSLTTFEEAGKMVEELSADGVEGFSIQYKNWSSTAVNDKYTQKFDPLKSLGGEKGLEKLNQVLAKQNAKMYLASDIQQFKSSANLFGLRSTTRMIDNAQLQISRVRRDNYDADIESRKYSFIPPIMLEEQMGRFVSTLPKDYKISLTNMEVYTDFGSNYSKRQQTVSYLEKMVSGISSKSSAELPNAFLIPSIDTAFNLGGEYGQYDVEDYGIPFYQIATQGMLSYSLESINLSADKTDAFLRSLEYGGGLMYTVIARDSRIAAGTQDNALYNCDFNTWKSEITEKYGEINTVYNNIGSELKSHNRLAEGVFKSDFNKGSVIVNYTDEPFIYNDITVDSNGYAVIEFEKEGDYEE